MFLTGFENDMDAGKKAAEWRFMMKKLGFGLMRLPQLDADNYGSVDVERVKKMADLFMEHGFTYFDTAAP